MANFGEEQGGGGGVSVVSSWPQNGDATIMYVLIIGALLLSFLVLLGLLRLCCQKDTSWSRVAYPVAISNRLFNVSFGTLVYCAYLHDKLHIFWKFLAPLYYIQCHPKQTVFFQPYAHIKNNNFMSQYL